MARVIRTPLARKDLKEIGRHIARESQNRSVAFRFLDTIEQKLQLHATQPRMGEERPDLGRDVRHFSVGRYVVFYRPMETGIEVLRLFIGSATETEELALSIAKGLQADDVQVNLWTSAFKLGVSSLRALQKATADSDFALFVWGMEDTTVARGKRTGSPRDNVVYEAGLFAGALGEQRVFVAHARDTKIPSDYLGITTAPFDLANPDPDVKVIGDINPLQPLAVLNTVRMDVKIASDQKKY